MIPRLRAFFEISITSSCGMMVPFRVFSSAMIRVGALQGVASLEQSSDIYFGTYTWTSVPETIRGSMSSQVRWCSGREREIIQNTGPIWREHTVSGNNWDTVGT
jgi:hypothetical protein